MSSSLRCLNGQGLIPSACEILVSSSLVLSTSVSCWVNAISTRAKTPGKPTRPLQKETELIFEKTVKCVCQQGYKGVLQTRVNQLYELGVCGSPVL